MALVKKTIELDQDAINRIKSALNVKSEKDAVNYVLNQFDAELQISEATLKWQAMARWCPCLKRRRYILM